MLFLVILMLILLIVLSLSMNFIAVQFKKARVKLNETRKNVTEIKTKVDNLDNVQIQIDKLESISWSIDSQIKQLVKRASMPDGILHLSDGVKFYLPHYPVDIISNDIVAHGNFFEFEILKKLEQHIVPNSIILDLGANIGNHSMYWSLKNHAKMIYAFEPQEHIFKILEKNIEINHITNVIPFNFALGAESSRGAFTKNTWEDNFGGQHIHTDVNGKLVIKSLDEVMLEEKPSTVDFIKCDVEEFEYQVLQGAKETLLKYKPTIFIEIFNPSLEKVSALLEELGYIKVEELHIYNYLFKHKDKI